MKYTKQASKLDTSPATKDAGVPEESSTETTTSAARRVSPVPTTATTRRRLVWRSSEASSSDDSPHRLPVDAGPLSVGRRHPAQSPLRAASRPPLLPPPPPPPPRSEDLSRHQPKRDGDTVSDNKHTPSQQAKDNDEKQPDVKHGRTEEKPTRARHNTRPERKSRRPQDYREVWRLKWKSK